MKANPLGDIRAEADEDMLGDTFIETPDYKTLITSNDRSIVVGRRGAGKSALSYGLVRYWKSVPKTLTIVLAPEEDQMIGLRPVVSRFGTSFNLLRAACRLSWRYALMMELGYAASKTYRYPHTHETRALAPHLTRWRRADGFSSRLRQVLLTLMPKEGSPEQRVGDLAAQLEINQVQDALVETMTTLKTRFVLLIDKLDEGYQADDIGTALADGLVLATIDLNDRLPDTRFTLFARDNVSRAIAAADPDYSRDIEGQILRLHWDEGLLLDLVCARLRRAFRLSSESNLKIWNRCTGSTLHGMDGFRKALRLTLYRPRDILSLLNQAFYSAAGHGQSQIVIQDLEATAHEISRTRLDDLHKEYRTIIPGLPSLTTAFKGRDPECSAVDAAAFLSAVADEREGDGAVTQHFEILSDTFDLVRSLYSIGFVGVKDSTSGTFSFCHDGRSPSRDMTNEDRLLVHPCYWMALGTTRPLLADTEAEEINDEYAIRIESQTPKIRKASLGRHIATLAEIPVGQEGAAAFEEWCLRSSRILFAGHLSNIELHPNRNRVQRRDIVGTNVAERGVWRRVYEDYGTRQVIFEVKNQYGLAGTEYRQMLSYLIGDYGKVGFIITRDDGVELKKENKELHWMKELYDGHNVLIVKLTAGFLSKLLSKARNPQKHDEADVRLSKLLDTYTRLYLGGRVASTTKKWRTRRLQ